VVSAWMIKDYGNCTAKNGIREAIYLMQMKITGLWSPPSKYEWARKAATVPSRISLALLTRNITATASAGSPLGAVVIWCFFCDTKIIDSEIFLWYKKSYAVDSENHRREKSWTDYVIIRHGSNAANQSMCQRAVVALVAQVKNREEALEEAMAYLTCYPNQHIELVPASKAKITDLREALELSIVEEVFCEVCGKTIHLERWKVAPANICYTCNGGQ